MILEEQYTEVKTKKDQEEKFILLSLALLAGFENLETVKSFEPDHILNNDKVQYALDILPEELNKTYTDWFNNLTALQVKLIYNQLQIKKKNSNYVFNDIAQLLIDEIEMKQMGAVFTPKWLANYITNKAFGFWKKLNAGKGEPELLGDLSCGPGVFLNALKENANKTASIYGSDSCPEYIFVSRLSNLNNSNITIECLDTLTDLNNTEQISLFPVDNEFPNSNYDIIVGNPPYVRSQSLNSSYSKTLKENYSKWLSGNFDLTVPFLAHTVSSLAPGGIGALVVSSKFMHSRYGKEICSSLAKDTRILEIVDFGDGQIFPNRTTYTCVIFFAKLAPLGDLDVYKFPHGLKWDDKGTYLKEGRKTSLPQKQLENHPWSLTTGIYEEILNKMARKSTYPKIVDIFPKILQGVRTGANDVFVIDKDKTTYLEEDLLFPFIDGTNIRRSYVKETKKKIIWPYTLENNEVVELISKDQMQINYKNIWAYIKKNETLLKERKLDNSNNWYSYSRSQNLKLPIMKKILVREMMPSSQFAADVNGTYVFSSGYGLIGKEDMPSEHYKLWAAILSTPTMEFQLRFNSTQLHSGWFRLLKQHLTKIRLIGFTEETLKASLSLVEDIDMNVNNEQAWEQLDNIVADAFELSEEMKQTIKEYLEEVHAVSKPNNLIEDKSEIEKIEMHKVNRKGENAEDNVEESIYPELNIEQRTKYMPVELTKYNKYHRDRPELRQLVTFKMNKKENTIHNWYNYTQGFSSELVEILLKELHADVDTDTVFDPFSGSGTTLLTAKSKGFKSFGVDISPLMTWVSKMKVAKWKVNKLKALLVDIETATPKANNNFKLLFDAYLSKAYAPEILAQIVGWRDWITEKYKADDAIKNFAFLGLISILEEISLIRKHGSHYRYLNNTDSVGVNKLNISVIDSSSNIKPLLLEKLTKMVNDVKLQGKVNKDPVCNIYNMNSRNEVPARKKADIVITSPPYLNRNNYFAQQKAELSILGLISSDEQYKDLVKNSYRSHVEAELQKEPVSKIEEVNKIIKAVELTDNNNPKIPHMISGYFDDLEQTLFNLQKILNPGARLAFVVGNSRWGGVVVPVDHILALIAERLGYKLEKILVARYKGNSPQQMKRYGKIKVRESIVILRWKG